MLLYVAGPYRGDVDANIASARKVAIALWEQGHVVICPHLNTANFEADCTCSDDVYLSGDLEILQRCDAIVMLGGWAESVGATGEHEFAATRGIPVFYWNENTDIPLDPVQSSCPQQCSAFVDTVMAMYRTHLAKNRDYSPANILGTGELGTVVRLWDKIARLMNLMGFRLKIESSEFEAPRQPNYESIDDTLLDAANYAVIAKLFRMGCWGK